MDEDSDFLPNKWHRSVGGRVDIISELPDDIIVVILSFLRLKEAVATSVLSSRWSHLWKHTPILNLGHILPGYDSDVADHHDHDGGDDDDDVQRDKCVEIVNAVIRSHKALSLKKFRLALPVFELGKYTVAKWLEFVFSRQVESLELSFSERDGLVLEELLRESRKSLQPQTGLIFFRSLKALSLGCLIVSGEDIELFLRNCPLLEELTVVWGTLTSDVEVCGANLMLKHLEIIDMQCNGQKSIKVSAANLTYMAFSSFGEGEWKLLFENVPKLFEANLSMESPHTVVQHFASSTSCRFSQLQILNLTLSTSQLQVIMLNGFKCLT